MGLDDGLAAEDDVLRPLDRSYRDHAEICEGRVGAGKHRSGTVRSVRDGRGSSRGADLGGRPVYDRRERSKVRAKLTSSYGEGDVV